MEDATANIITIDGPAGSGKSTVSRALACLFGYAYLDTGAMYRAVGFKAAFAKAAFDNAEEMAALLDDLDLQILPGEQEPRIILDQKDISFEIRTPEMGMMASLVSAQPIVRKKLTEIQRQMGQKGSVVAEGRDMGTVVFPQAKFKFYLDAAPEERARRRTEQLLEKDIPADYQDILTQIQQRDHDDSSRALAPLRPAEDAVIIDSSHMTIDEVINFIAEKIKTIQHNG
jgi:cytidylate kinase